MRRHGSQFNFYEKNHDQVFQSLLLTSPGPSTLKLRQGAANCHKKFARLKRFDLFAVSFSQNIGHIWIDDSLAPRLANPKNVFFTNILLP